MSKRNFILLIIILIIIVASVFLFLYSRQNATTPGGNNTGTNFISQFNPFASKPSPSVVKPPDNSGYQPNPPQNTISGKLNKISSMGVAGFGLFNKERLKDVGVPVPVVPTPATTGTSTSSTTTKNILPKPTPPPTEFATAVRYVDKATGNIYQTFADKIEERKFSSTVIPEVYDSYFGNNGGSVIMRYLKADDATIETFVGTLPKELLGGDTTGNNEIKGTFLPDNVKDISISPDTSKVFYLFTGENSASGYMIGTILNLLTNKKTQVFDSPFTEWLPQWPTPNIIALSTKPSADVPGYIYNMDGSGKNLTKILGDVKGLTTLTSPNGKLIVYSDGNLSLNVYHTDTRTSSTLGLKTLSEKCVWGSASDIVYCAVPKSITSGQYPDTWYQGEVSFNDQLWKIDIKTGNTTMISDPALVTNGEELDGTKLAIDQNGNYLFFVNKKDSFLWKLDLK